MALGAATALTGRASAAVEPRPNIVMFLTDDQTLAEMEVLPQTASLIGGQGVTFDRAYVSYPLCCPSRATFLTGQYMHNHQIRGNSLPEGGWAKFAGSGVEERSLPVWMRDAGYYTAHVGKYLNGYPEVAPIVPAGWNEWYGKLSQYSPVLFGNKVYFNYNLLEQGPDGAPQIVSYGQNEGDYQTDVLRDKAVDAIHRLGGPGTTKPFYLDVGFSAPHSPYVAPGRDDGAFGGAPVSSNAAVNEKNVKDKPRFMRRLKPLNRKQRISIRIRQRARWAQLLSVDQSIAAIVDALAQERELDNTYVIFTSDNGYFSGEHRISQGKYLPHEPSSHVPLMIRGPGIPAGGRSRELVSNIDVAPTISAIANATPILTQDGRSLLPYAQNPAALSTRPLLLEGDTGSNLAGGEAIEASARASGSLAGKKGVDNLEQDPPLASTAKKFRAPAFRAIRTDRWLFVRYAKAGLELYDMLRDPLQLRSLHAKGRYRPVMAALKAQLKLLERCAGSSCTLSSTADAIPVRGAGK